MNHFELFEIPVSFQPDAGQLKKKFDALSRHYSPDHPAHASTEEKAEMLEKSSQVDRAYRIFQSEDETIRYVLQLKGLLEKKEEYEPDPQFELEVMDINEELMELELDEKQELLMNTEQKATRLLSKIYEDVATVIENYQEHITTEEELLQVKDFYFKKKYLQRILDRIRGIRNIASPS